MPAAPQFTHYQVLNLPRNPPPSSQDVKRAYHRALLENHPDKTRSTDLLTTEVRDNRPATNHVEQDGRLKKDMNSWNIDQIVAAYTILSSPGLRSEYDQALASSTALPVCLTVEERGHIGVERYDLDDLEQHTNTNGEVMWSKDCRCGDGQGYTVTETQLEEATESDTDQYEEIVKHGEKEIYVGCKGCSLFIKVLFAVQSED